MFVRGDCIGTSRQRLNDSPLSLVIALSVPASVSLARVLAARAEVT